jgi:catechol 2,3-dioxygenase
MEGGAAEAGRSGSGGEFALDPRTDIGHVHLKVSDLERAERFYVDVLGFRVRARYGSDAVFLAAGDYHHHIGLNTWQSKGGPPPPPGSTGLFHFAIRVPTRRHLAEVFVRLHEAGVRLSGASDHLVSEALYLNDPDGNGLEIYADRDPESWPRSDGGVEMQTLPLDVESLLAELET